MNIFSFFISFVVAVISYLVYTSYVNTYSSIVTKPDKRYDYIIVGAGTAGCVLAARLSEDPDVKVLLVEAGDQMGFFTKIPLTSTAAQQGPNDWSVRTTPQKYSSFGLWDQTQIIPRGKGLGGSGQINFLLHGFGLPEDYNRWSRKGFKGWTFKDLKPYFIKAFGTTMSEYDSTHCHETSRCNAAPMKLKLLSEDNELMKTFKQASSALGGRGTVLRRPAATVSAGLRHSSWDGYLKPAMQRPNLHVLLNTQAVSIRFDNVTATSLYILQNHRNLDNIFVDREIILCAGAIKSPQILMLSGIGRRDLIKRLKLNLVVENAHVGANLHDHMNMPLYVSVRKPVSITLAKVFTATTLWDYVWRRQGYLSFPPVSGVEYQNKSAVMVFALGSASERLLRDLSNYKHQVYRDTYPFHNDTRKEGFMFLTTCSQPRSRGQVTLRDSSTSVPPLLDTNYLHQYHDVACMIKAIRRAERLVSTKAFQEIGARIHWPRPERCRTFWRYSAEDQAGLKPKRKRFKSTKQEKKPKEAANVKPKSPKMSPPDEYLECLLREVAVTGHHAAGTCAGGTVVDNHLRVKGVKGLRIMDASVLPTPLSLYPNSVLVGMAEKAADLIRNTPETLI
ncbi:PREDICTED: neither inactivation nor afterpotential protein G [Papilio xuthus]|uniref:Neither inactivation nor afterpotential protein G n=1 Tax=Papilio xuthus TaxID=66420 RepID=A0AAJ6ZCQ3_PAPXU|nr:PREDICTED: neither inactivation nor afterpotential protein G [Papilio xuthus]